MEVCLRSACGEIELKTHVLRPLSAPERRRDSTQTIYKQNTKNVFSWLFRFCSWLFLIFPLRSDPSRSSEIALYYLSSLTHSLTHSLTEELRLGSELVPDVSPGSESGIYPSTTIVTTQILLIVFLSRVHWGYSTESRVGSIRPL